MTDGRLHADEVATDAELVRRLLVAQLPHLSDLPIMRVPSTGTVHWLYRLGADLVVRLPRIAGGASEVAKEAAWLPMLAAQVPTAVPEPVALGEPGADYPWPWAVYRWVEGRHPVADALQDAHGLAQDLAAVVRALGELPTTGAPRAFRGERLEARDEITRSSIAAAADLMDAEALLAIWADSLDGASRPDAYPWQHGDLFPGNFLVGPDGRLAGVIDWGCTGTGDPAVDLLPAWAVLTPDARCTFRDALDVDDDRWRRGRAWALSICALQTPYYRDTNPELTAVGLRALAQIAADAR